MQIQTSTTLWPLTSRNSSITTSIRKVRDSNMTLTFKRFQFDES